MNVIQEEVEVVLNEFFTDRDVMPSESFNNYAAVIDLDGNAWSDRLPMLLMSNTPILKQEYSAWTEYFGHLLTEEHVTFFKDDLSDILEITEKSTSNWRSRQKEMEAQVQRAFDFASEHVSHQGVIRAMAYTLTKYASLMTWTIEMEEGYEFLPPSLCCQHNPSLPSKLISRANFEKSS